jgi:VRR-NUC domain.
MKRGLNNIPIPTEHEEQVKVFEWAELVKGKYPEISLMFAVPNGSNKSVASAMKFKREGLKSGVPDICLPVARCNKHGLYIEMKRKKGGVVSKEQDWWLTQLRIQGYETVVCYGGNEAIDIIERYLECKE